LSLPVAYTNRVVLPIDFTDLPVMLREQIQHFRRHYKDFEKDKWVKIIRWIGPDEAANLIMATLARSKAKI
jgi:inorganic pyrophosphatase